VIVKDSGVDIATEDHRGEGPPLLLTHGAGTTRGSLARLVPQLTPAFHVVTFDLRNHGDSGVGRWEWDGVVADVEAVRVAYGFERPVVAGHSLGGMVAAKYAVAHPDTTRCAINIDGHGQGFPEQYDGMTPDEVASAWTRLEEMQEKLMPAASEEEARRRDEMMDVLRELDMFGLWRAVTVPLQIFNAYGPDPMATSVEGMEWYGDVMSAYRRGLGRALAALAASVPTITITPIDAAHFLIVTHPEEVAARMIEFVSTSGN
jgi:pimeloyl-ACP methyl ester carboxylesterase